MSVTIYIIHAATATCVIIVKHVCAHPSVTGIVRVVLMLAFIMTVRTSSRDRLRDGVTVRALGESVGVSLGVRFRVSVRVTLRNFDILPLSLRVRIGLGTRCLG